MHNRFGTIRINMGKANKDNCIKHQQTNKCHTFSVLLLNQLSLYMPFLHDCFDFMQQFLEALAFFLMRSHSAPNFQNVVLIKLFLARKSQLS